MLLILKTNKQLLSKLLIFFDLGVFYFFKKVLSSAIFKIHSVPGYNFFMAIRNIYLYPTLYLLKYHTLCLFHILIDIISIDWVGTRSRFSLLFSLLSIKYNSRFLIKATIKPYGDLLSCTSLFFSANWLEREIYEFYGIFFSLNKDLRHLLLDYGFCGYPLRKDFPLSGFIEVVYNDTNKKLIYRNLELVQAYRQAYLKRFLI